MARNDVDKVGDVPTGRCMGSADEHERVALFCIFNLPTSHKDAVKEALTRFPIQGQSNRRGGVCFEAGESTANQAIDAVRKVLTGHPVTPSIRRMG